MKKITLSFLASMFAFGLFAQPIADATYTDCNTNTRSIYQALATGKVLVVANAGTNCSICMSHANSVADLANNNASSIEVWGAITTKTGGNPGCTALDSWVNTYSWSNVFTFLDVNQDWFYIGTPRYTVVNPADSSIAYAGSNWTTAQNTALQLSNTVGVTENEIVSNLMVTDLGISFQTLNQVTNGKVDLISITGQTVESWAINATSNQVDLQLNGHKPTGIYLLHIQVDGKQYVEKIML